MPGTEEVPNPPSWLNQTFLETALKKGLKNDELRILKCDIKTATTAGDNYSSLLLRINLSIKTGSDENNKDKKENLSVIVKTLVDGKMADELRKYSIFEKEGEALWKILPELDSLLEKAYQDHEKLAPVCYYCQGSPNDILVMEDLRLGGYILGNRFEGLDMEHTVLVLKSLAKLHASSFVLREKDPKIFEKFETCFWSAEHMDSMKSFIITPFKVLSQDVLKWEDFEKKEIYSKKFQNLEETVLDRIFKLWEKDDTKLNVFLHGDSWVNNFMFRYDPSGKITGMKFVDLQLANINSPVMELQYFIFTSVKPDLKYNNIDFFLKTYYEAFEEALERFNHEPKVGYDLDKLKKDFEEKYFWGLVVLCTIFPILIMPPDEVCHADEFFNASESSKFEKMYRKDNFRKLLKQGLAFFEEKNVF